VLPGLTPESSHAPEPTPHHHTVVNDTRSPPANPGGLCAFPGLAPTAESRPMQKQKCPSYRPASL